ncbi:hypothetical protein HMPREF0201_04030 [Cedecea davisae DSM 4568]|uniref:Uncharacterized protein n=1 Tax=Cedecea davisae DSM 4568 TaxID=566551 RepID=S3J1M3_9ENTR|nr:hypothetical protein HMPREF0201_04030 [Cedecea davisae DSM 4568]
MKKTQVMNVLRLNPAAVEDELLPGHFLGVAEKTAKKRFR